MVAGLQTATAQGFRVYKSDGTFTQFSFRTDSIVFYEGAGEEVDFGLFTPVNQIVVGKWYKNHNETVNFNEDGTTDYYPNGTYEYIPYQSEILVFNSSKVLKSILKVHKVTPEQMVVSTLGSTSFSVWTSTQPPQLVEQIELDKTELILDVNEVVTLTASVLPEDAENPAVIWESSNEAVAEIIRIDGNKCYVLAVAGGTSIITCRATDGSGVKAECPVMVVVHEYVDLGLPSGTLWAMCNVGANSPEEYGDYFAWGETEPKEDYYWDTYRFYDTANNKLAMTKYCTNSDNGTVDNKTELEIEDDAATVNWGVEWQMPSIEQFKELINSEYTTTKWTTLNGVNGRMIVSMSNGNSIFLPAVGEHKLTNFVDAGSYGYYWSRSLGPNRSTDAYYLSFHSSSIYTSYTRRDFGYCVRPVRVQTQ